MRLVTYRGTDGLRAGIETKDGTVVDAAAVAERAGWEGTELAAAASNRLLLGLEAGRVAALQVHAEADAQELVVSGRAWTAGMVGLGPPIPDPGKIICIGLNYSDHATEVGAPLPKSPMFFAKWANSLVGPQDAIVPPRHTTKVDYEAELLIAIGRGGRDISHCDALDHVAGAMAFNDVSARDLQLANQLWTGGKAIDTFGPCGPALVSRDALGDLQDLAVRAWVDGELVQDGSTASMVFGVAELIAFLSRIMTLEPGDLIATGTPAGVGQSRDPQLFLTPGSLVEVEVEGIGRLANRVIAPG